MGSLGDTSPLGRSGSQVAKLLALLLALVVLLALPSRATADVPAGFDLFETDPGMTVFQFTDEFTIPPNFFAPGSEPFQGSVNFSGVPVNSFNNKDIGDTDTIVRRPEGSTLPGPGSDSTVPIELVQLSLQSVAPITVMVGGQPQTWDVRAGLSPSRPSQGGMTINQTSGEGGTFSSQFQVFPVFTFRRLSDGQIQTLDVGAMQQTPQSLQDLTLQAGNAPWRQGCERPALAVKGINDQFCPTQNTDEDKVLTVEGSRLAQHGIRPAQPRLEHFKCYSVRQRGRFRKRKVSLVDQFGARNARVVKPQRLCNPVKKNREPLKNTKDHLKCYTLDRVDPAFQRRTAHVRNQFGYQFLEVRKPRTLCVPSTKRKLPTRQPPPKPEPDIDHFTCYDVAIAGRHQPFQVRLRDQFGSEQPQVLRPRELCAPAQKNRDRIEHPVRHLLCYEITGNRYQLLVLTRNQFGRELLRILRSQRLCVPSVKLLQLAGPPTGGPPTGGPPVTTFRINLDSSWQQIGPMERIICTNISTDPPQPGAQGTAELTPPSGMPQSRSIMTDGMGHAMTGFQTNQTGPHGLKVTLTKDGQSSEATQMLDVQGPTGPRPCT